jgi:predicted MPP superfamily phosphohydrolase
MSQMILVLAGYLCIYGTVHLYFLVKARRAYYLQGLGYGLLAAVLLFLMLAPLQGRLLEAQGYVWPAAAVTWIGFLWMGFLFLFLCLSLPLDSYHLLIGAGQRLTGSDWTGLMLSRRQSLGFATAIAIGLMGYGAFEAYQVETRTIVLPSKKIAPSSGRIRIVQISDLHLGIMTFPGRLTPVLEAIRQAKPDVLVSTGDLIDGTVFGKAKIAATLNSLAAPMGKYAVTGNHAYYMNTEAAQAFIENAGFTLLSDRSITIRQLLTIAGVDDPAKRASGDKAMPTEAAILENTPDQVFRLLLKHRPVIDADSKGKFDLQLSGHTHHGQIFPFGLIVFLRYPLRQGLNRITTDSHIYVSSGTGTWGPPLRLLTPPEITVIDIVPNP